MKTLLSVDPDNPSAVSVTSISQTSALVSWSKGQTQVVNATTVHYRATDSTVWNNASATGTAHTVTSLQPGTEYQFFVKINSFGKTSKSQNVTATTGRMS